MKLTPFTPTPLMGLVLAGGRSTRMGTAKEELRWYGKQQQYAMADLLAKFCSAVSISCRPDQLEKISKSYTALPDAFPGMGPAGGILSAFQSRKEAAWLVVACDLPLLDEKALDFLVRCRNPEKTATVYESPVDQGPEPLAAIWEPESFPLLLDFLKTGSRSPRKFLMSNDVLLLKPENPEVLRNVNTPEQAAEIQQILKDTQ